VSYVSHILAYSRFCMASRAKSDVTVHIKLIIFNNVFLMKLGMDGWWRRRWGILLLWSSQKVLAVHRVHWAFYTFLVRENGKIFRFERHKEISVL